MTEIVHFDGDGCGLLWMDTPEGYRPVAHLAATNYQLMEAIIEGGKNMKKLADALGRYLEKSPPGWLYQ